MCTKHISKLANFICEAVAQIWNFGHAYNGRLREAFLENMVNHILIWRWGHPLALAFPHGSGVSGEFESGLEMSFDSNGLFVEALMTETHFAHYEVWGLRCMPSLAFTSFDSSTWANHATHCRHCNKWPKSTAAAASVISICPLKVQKRPDKKPQTRPFLLQYPQVWTKAVGQKLFGQKFLSFQPLLILPQAWIGFRLDRIWLAQVHMAPCNWMKPSLAPST